MPANPPAVFQLEDPTWFDDDVFALLRSHNRAFCVVDTDETPVSEIKKTADWGYVRLRRASYSVSELKKWIARIRAEEWKQTFVFFKHEDEGKGAAFGQQMMELLQKP